jgi:hypothetical protein
MTRALLILGMIAGSMQASTFDLNTDFSNLSNPNGVWSFTQGATLLTKFDPPYPAGCCSGGFQNVLTNGYWGLTAPVSGGGGSFFFPDDTVAKVTGNGSATGTETDNDFLTGDIVAHSTNPGNGPDLFIRWTAPQAGTIDSYSGGVWYAHSQVSRSNDFFLTLNGGPNLATGSVTNGVIRSTPVTFNSAGSVHVNTGDVLALRLAPTSGQQFGSLSGLNLTVNFTADPVGAPEPSTFALAGGVLVLAWFRRRR